MLKDIIKKIKTYSIATHLDHRSIGIVPDPRGNIIILEELKSEIKKEKQIAPDIIFTVKYIRDCIKRHGKYKPLKKELVVNNLNRLLKHLGEKI